MKRFLTSVVAGLFMAAGVSVLVAPAAHAAACSGDSGVTVIVDFGSLGKPLTAGCDPSVGGERAGQSFVDAGFPLNYATKDPSFVCRVSGLPADDPCTDAAQSDRYWSLWWSDGHGGPWVYASRGVSSLRSPEGGYLAFKFHTGGGRASAPAVAPTVRTKPAAPSTPPATAKAKPTNQPKKRPTRKARPSAPASASSSGSASASASVTASVTPSASATPSATGSATATATASAAPSASVTAASATPSAGLPAADEITAGPEDVKPAAAEAKDGLPVWVPIVVVVALVGVAGGLAARHRTR